jgi:hypothetical protein
MIVCIKIRATEEAMTHALARWLWRIVSPAVHLTQDPPRAGHPPMKIVVERLPDYMWRNLGFSQRRPPNEVDDWPAW